VARVWRVWRPFRRPNLSPVRLRDQSGRRSASVEDSSWAPCASSNAKTPFACAHLEAQLWGGSSPSSWLSGRGRSRRSRAPSGRPKWRHLRTGVRGQSSGAKWAPRGDWRAARRAISGAIKCIPIESKVGAHFGFKLGAGRAALCPVDWAARAALWQHFGLRAVLCALRSVCGRT